MSVPLVVFYLLSFAAFLDLVDLVEEKKANITPRVAIATFLLNVFGALLVLFLLLNSDFDQRLVVALTLWLAQAAWMVQAFVEHGTIVNSTRRRVILTFGSIVLSIVGASLLAFG